MLFYYLIGNGKPYTGASYRFVCLIEFFLNTVYILCRDSYARILYGNADAALLRGLLNQYLTAAVGILNGVINNIYKYLL